MTPFLILVCFIFPSLGLRRDQVVVVISDNAVRLFGFVILVGIVFGYVNFNLDGWSQTLLLITYLFSALWLSHRGCSSFQEKASMKREPSLLLVIPGIFTLVSLVTVVLYPNRAIGYLLNTWDGSSNAGLVRGMEVAGSIDFSPETQIGPWISYPRGAHLLASWLAEVTSFSSEQIAENIAITFVFLTWVVYAFLILQIGRLANLTSEFVGLGRTGLPISIICQGIMLSPMFLNEIVKLHSLAFITAMAIGMYAIVLVLGVLQRRNVSLSNYSMTSALLFVTACHTYPLVVPIVLVTLIPPVFMRSHFSLRFGMVDYIKVLVSVMTYAIGTVSFLSLINATDPGNRYSMGGHIYVIEQRWIYLLITLSVIVVLFTWFRSKTVACVLGIIVTGLCIMWQGLWFLAESDERTYGVNYYPKKMEYFLVVLLLPVAFSLLLFVWSSTKTNFARLQFWSMVFVSLFIVVTQTWGGFLNTLFFPIKNDKISEKIVPLIIREAETPGRSVIWDSQDNYVSRSASFLANYLDRSSWLVSSPDTLELNIVLHQQLIDKGPSTTPIELCYLVPTKEFGPGRVVDVRNQATFDCPSR